MAIKKQTAVSGIQASGILHIGNYIGAIEQFVKLQNEYKMFVFIADLHAITVPQDPKTLRENTLSVAAIYLACGLDPKKTTLFVQSHVPAHTELGWILNTITPLSELRRMTQFKEKTGLLDEIEVLKGLAVAGKEQDREMFDKAVKLSVEELRGQSQILAGLFNYPTLMAADILLYNADVVPVGEDQVQHIELTRTLARKFNRRFGKTFKEPKELLRKEGARIMALDEPEKKMAKSAASPNNYIALIDTPSEIRRKIKSAVTDSEKEIKYEPGAKPGISNLLSIYSALSGDSIQKIESRYRSKNYREFKSSLAELVVRKLSPIQDKYKTLLKNPKTLKKILNDGAKKASAVAQKTLTEVKEKIGLLKN